MHRLEANGRSEVCRGRPPPEFGGRWGMSSEMHARGPSRRQAARADDPVLTSKLAPPRVPGWVVPRKRIERRIADGARGPLTVVTGPPGAGKTIAVASWAATSGLGPVAWVTIDEYDNRQKVFWSYVLAGLPPAAGPAPPAGGGAGPS